MMKAVETSDNKSKSVYEAVFMLISKAIQTREGQEKK
jgi:hypothetical protein